MNYQVVKLYINIRMKNVYVIINCQKNDNSQVVGIVILHTNIEKAMVRSRLILFFFFTNVFKAFTI